MEGIVLLGFTILAATVAIGISVIKTDQRRALQEMRDELAEIKKLIQSTGE